MKKHHQLLAHNFDLILTSFHEAGHVIYGLLHLMKVTGVSIRRNSKIGLFEGYTNYDTVLYETVESKQLFNILVKAEICISYAGLISEQLLYQSISGSHKYPNMLKHGSSDDFKSADEIINKHKLTKDKPKFRQKMMKAARQDLLNHWEAVIAVAYAIFEKKKLKYLDLKKILTKNARNNAFWISQFKDLDKVYKKAKFPATALLNSIIT